MSLQIPVTSEFVFDNFSHVFFGNSVANLHNPVLVLPNNITQVLNPQNVSAITSSNYNNTPQYLQFNVNYTSALLGQIELFRYVFDYPVNLQDLIVNYISQPDRCFYCYIETNSPGIRIIVKVEIEDYASNSILIGHFQSNNTGPFSGIKKVLIDTLISLPSNAFNVRSIRVFFDSSAAFTGFIRFYSFNFSNYPLFNESPPGKLVLYDNFTLHQYKDSLNPSPVTINTDNSFRYISSSQNQRTFQMVNVFPGANGIISTFSNFIGSSISPVGVIITTDPDSTPNRSFEILYPSLTIPSNSNDEYYGTLAYVVNQMNCPVNTFGLTIQGVIKDSNTNTETLFFQRVEKITDFVANEIQYINFKINFFSSSPSGDFIIRIIPANVGASNAFRLYILHISMFHESHVITPSTTQTNFLHDSFTHVISGQTGYTVGTPKLDPNGVFPKNVTKTYNYTGSFEDNTSGVFPNIPANNNTSIKFLEYNFSPPAMLLGIRDFILVCSAEDTSNSFVQTNITFRVKATESTLSTFVEYSGSISISSGQNGFPELLFLKFSTLQNLDTILQSISKIELFLDSISTIGNITSLTVRIFCIAATYNNRFVPLYENFISDQLGGFGLYTSKKVDDLTLNYTGHPQRLLYFDSTINVHSSIFESLNNYVPYPFMRHYKMELAPSSPGGNGIFRVQFKNINLLDNYKYNILCCLILAEDNLDLTKLREFRVIDKVNNTIVYTQNIVFTNRESIISTDLPITEDLELEIEFSTTSNPSTHILMTFFVINANETTCVLEGTHVTMADGTLKKIEEIQRGELVLTKHGPLPVSRVIREALGQRVKLIKVPKGSIDKEKGIPYNDLLVCLGHIVRLNNKRSFAYILKAFEGVQELSGKRDEITDKRFMYNLQFDIETFYYAEGLESQSRSPYCHLSPLPKQFYFKKNLFRNIRVSNALMDETDIINNNWPNVNKKFCWRTFLTKYIIEKQETINPKDFNEQKAIELSKYYRIDLDEIIPQDFDWREYIKVNPDLKHFRNEMEACIHWFKYGYREKRYYKK
jgi:hypothetical protein